MEKARVFLSFDVAHDRDLHDRLLAESRRSAAFSVAARSELGSAAAGGEERVRERIAAVDAVIVICGEHTDESADVAAELRISREQKKPHLFLWGRRECMCKKPAGARNEDGIYGWTAENLRNQLASALRAERPVPQHLRRQVAPKPVA